VNFASTTNGVSTQDIVAAANAIAKHAADVLPILQAAASGNPYTNNQTNLTLRGGSFTELAGSYARGLFLPGLYVGGNLKLIIGNIGYKRFKVLGNSAGTTGALSQYNDVAKRSIQPALDLGVLWDLKEMFGFLPLRPRVGLVGRNLNNPKFTQPAQAVQDGEGDKFALNPQVRFGAAISPFNFWHVAFDIDVTKNNTPIPGYNSRTIGLGTEINIFNRPWLNIPLRAGLMKNVEDPASKITYTFGFGLNFLHFMVDLGGSISSERTDVRAGEKVPSNASVGAQLAFLF